MMSSIPGKFKMADETEIVKLYYEYKYPAIVNKILQKRYPGMKPLSRLQFHRLNLKHLELFMIEGRKELGDQKLPDRMRTFSLSGLSLKKHPLSQSEECKVKIISG